jgi:hypothetical protein
MASGSLLEWLWLDGLYPQVILYLRSTVAAQFGGRARIESIRLVIGGYPANTAIGGNGQDLGALLDTQSYKDLLAMEENLIDGFMLRITVP